MSKKLYEAVARGLARVDPAKHTAHRYREPEVQGLLVRQ